MCYADSCLKGNEKEATTKYVKDQLPAEIESLFCVAYLGIEKNAVLDVLRRLIKKMDAIFSNSALFSICS